MGGGGEVVRREERTVVNWFCTGVRGRCCGKDDSGSAHMAGITYKCPTDLQPIPLYHSMLGISSLLSILSHGTCGILCDVHGPVKCLSQCPMVHVGSHGMSMDQ